MSSKWQSRKVLRLRIVGSIGTETKNAEGRPLGVVSREKWASRRAHFVRQYDAIRRADIEGDLSTVYSGCKIGLDLLREGNLFGPDQQRVEMALKRRIATIRGDGSFPRRG